MGGCQSAPSLPLLNPSTVAAYTAAGFWGNQTICHLAARHAQMMPRACAVRDRHRSKQCVSHRLISLVVFQNGHISGALAELGRAPCVNAVVFEMLKEAIPAMGLDGLANELLRLRGVLEFLRSYDIVNK